MTSSLVGSEMCIRDRCMSLAFLHFRCECSVTSHQGKKGKCNKLSTDEAVSYTHLTLPTICSV
eukprot:6533479-Prorocentrum_lima.AAC.1